MFHTLYNWSNLDSINLDWFVREFFNLADYMKKVVKDNDNMKQWVLKNVKPVAVIDELIKATGLKDEDKKQIRENLGVVDVPVVDVPVVDIKVDGVSVVHDKIAEIVMPEAPDVPIKDVKVGNNSVVSDGLVSFHSNFFEATTAGVIVIPKRGILSSFTEMNEREINRIRELLGIYSVESEEF